MNTSEQSSAQLPQSEPKPLRIEYAVINAESTNEMEKKMTEELNRTDCVVRCVGGLSVLVPSGVGWPWPWMFYQPITRSYL